MTTEKSTVQHSAISVVVHSLAQRARQLNSFNRVGSPRALKTSGFSSKSSSELQQAACLGDLGTNLLTCAIMQVYRSLSGKSRGRLFGPNDRRRDN